MFSFITQHNATDVASFEGVCILHADCRNVHQSCCPWIECSCLTTANHLRKLICMPVVLIRVLTRLQFVVLTDFSEQMLTFDGIWHIGEVLSSRMNPSFYCLEQMADSVCGVVWVSSLLMSTLWIKWPMVAVGLWYGQAYVWTMNKGIFIDEILNAQRYTPDTDWFSDFWQKCCIYIFVQCIYYIYSIFILLPHSFSFDSKWGDSIKNVGSYLSNNS